MGTTQQKIREKGKCNTQCNITWKTRELHDDQIADRDEHDCWIWMPVLIQPRRDTVMELLSQPNHQNTRKTNYRSVETHV